MKTHHGDGEAAENGLGIFPRWEGGEPLPMGFSLVISSSFVSLW